MAKIFFQRNNPDVIQDAITLPIEEFVSKYTECTYSNAQLLEKAYSEIRFANKPKEQPPLQKEVTFKVIQTDKKVIPITPKPKVEETEDDDGWDDLTDQEKQELQMLEAQNDVQNGSLHSKEEVTDNLMPKSGKGRPFLANATERDETILKYIKEGKKGTEIIKLMKDQGFSVHAPQITAIKQKWQDSQKAKK